jgi:hypothetical protein
MARTAHTLAFAILLAAVPAAAGQGAPPEIGITADRDPLVAGEPFELQITISTESENDPVVRLPRLNGLRVLSQSESHPMSFSFSFGTGQGMVRQSKRQSIYSFTVVSDAPGRKVVEPVIVEVDGKRFQSEPHALVITASTGAPGPAPSPAPQGPFGQMPSPFGPPDDQAQPGQPGQAPEVLPGELEGARIDPDYFVQTVVSKHRAVAGEALVVTVYLYTAWQIADVDVSREPGTEGFWVENLLPGSRRLDFEPVRVGGKDYDRAVLRKLAVFPIREGTLTLAPAVVDLEIRRGGFFSSRKSVKRAAVPVQIEVAAAPADKRPAGFDPANVGRYSFKAEADRASVAVGEPVTLTMTVRGEGNLRNLSLPVLGDVAGFKSYDPESETEVSASGETVTGTRTSRTLLIPKEPGTFSIPGIAFSFFDPASGEYRTQPAGPWQVTVGPGAAAAPQAASSAAPARVVDDGDALARLNRQLRSISSRAELETSGGALLMTRPWYLALALLAPLAWLAVVLASRTRRQMAEKRVKGRSKRAEGNARRRLEGLARRASELSTEAFFAELQRCLVGFLEERLESQIAGDTTVELKARLAERGFEAGLSDRVATEIEGLEFARFGRSAGRYEERTRALDRVALLVKDLGAVTPLPARRKP